LADGYAAAAAPPRPRQAVPMPRKSGTLLDSFDLCTEGRVIAAEIRRVRADDGTEMLWHYAVDHLGFVHPAKRCTDCGEVITSDSIGGRCYGCAAADGLNL